MSAQPATDSDSWLGEDGDNAMHWVRAINDYTQWMLAAGLSHHTIASRRGCLRRLAEAHLRRSPWRVHTADLEQWMASQSWGNGTRRSQRVILRSFYTWAHKTKRIRHNPAADLPTVRAPKNTPRPTPDDVIDQALKNATDRDRLMIYLAAYAGLRRSEIAGLRWDQIQGVLGSKYAKTQSAEDSAPSRGVGSPGVPQKSPQRATTQLSTIRVHGKGDKTRVVPLHPVLHRELTAEWFRRGARARTGTGYRYRAGLDGPWLFPGRHDGHISGDAVARALRKLLNGWSVHTLRHRFASNVYRVTGDILQVAELLGHSKPETSAGYARIPDTALRDAVNAI